MSAWLRRRFRRPPTVRDCMRAALRAQCEPGSQSDRDPYAGVVTGPELVARTLANRAAHHASLADDDGFPIVEWGPYVHPYLGDQT